MTEDEAKTKWCPHARVSVLEECTMGVATYSYNRAGTAELPDDCMCIASNCMHGCDREGNWLGYCGLAK